MRGLDSVLQDTEKLLQAEHQRRNAEDETSNGPVLRWKTTLTRKWAREESTTCTASPDRRATAGAQLVVSVQGHRAGGVLRLDRLRVDIVDAEAQRHRAADVSDVRMALPTSPVILGGVSYLISL